MVTKKSQARQVLSGKNEMPVRTFPDRESPKLKIGIFLIERTHRNCYTTSVMIERVDIAIIPCIRRVIRQGGSIIIPLARNSGQGNFVSGAIQSFL